MLSLFASEGITQNISIKGTLIDAKKSNGIHNGKITAIQKKEKIEQSTAANGSFELILSEGPANIIYQAPGYGKLEDTITVTKESNRTIVKKIQRDSVDGWLTILLLIPGVLGLLVAWFKESYDVRNATSKSANGRMAVALVNGVVWAAVLTWIWYNASLVHGVTKIQFFNSSLAIEFFVPLLGYLGSLLFVFDLFRAKNSDSFKDKEFGMRIIMGPYVAMVIVALFGKEFDFINLESETDQGALAFVSGLIVVVAIQGIIERANEMLGKWRRKNNPYEASPLAEKFKLSEDEDKELNKIVLRHPDQLLMWSNDDLCKKLAEVDLDEHFLLAIKRKVEMEHLRSDIGDLVWNRLKPENVSTIQDFATLSNEKLQQIAEEKPELSKERLTDLQGKTIKFLDCGNGTAFN
jgi:hypothetical protein